MLSFGKRTDRRVRRRCNCRHDEKKWRRFFRLWQRGANGERREGGDVNLREAGFAIAVGSIFMLRPVIVSGCRAGPEICMNDRVLMRLAFMVMTLLRVQMKRWQEHRRPNQQRQNNDPPTTRWNEEHIGIGAFICDARSKSKPVADLRTHAIARKDSFVC